MARTMLCLGFGGLFGAKRHQALLWARQKNMETKTVFIILFVLTGFMLVLAQYVLFRAL